MKNKLLIAVSIPLLTLFSCGENTSVSNQSSSSPSLESSSSSIDPMQEECDRLYNALSKMSFSDSYADSLYLHERVYAHKQEHGCDKLDWYTYKFQYLLGGRWVTKDKNNYYLSLTREYENYDNTYYSDLFGTNLKSSQISGRSYYYYMNVLEDGRLAIGYEDRLLEESTDNFLVSFYEDHLSLINLIDKKTYEFYLDESEPKEIKGNAKLAYTCIGSHVMNFKYPKTVNVTSCYAKVDTNTVYAEIEAKNDLGLLRKQKYVFILFSSGYVAINETDNTWSVSNVDLKELNEKLQAYVAKMG